MKLNLEQSKHLAGTIRIAAIGIFGLYGYPFLAGKGGSVEGFLLAALMSLAFELVAVTILSEDKNDRQ